MSHKGAQGFENYYGELWGERWSALAAALRAPDVKVTLPCGYALDPASRRVGEILRTSEGGRILDMCAAPGGKSLVSIFNVQGNAQWVLNDLSRGRVHRLKRVLNEFVPAAWHAQIKVTCHDASRWGLYEKDVYDRVLLDAPCSGERHLLESPQDLASWSKKRGEGLAHRQYALLCAALDATKPGGRIVYSTCSINAAENDGVLQKLQRKKGERFQFINEAPAENEEVTEFGRYILPDRAEGWGPIFFAILQKN